MTNKKQEQLREKFKKLQDRYANQCAYDGDPYYGKNTDYEDDDFTNDVMNLFDQALSQKEESVLDMIAENEGWEESRDFYAKKLGLPTKYDKK